MYIVSTGVYLYVLCVLLVLKCTVRIVCITCTGRLCRAAIHAGIHNVLCVLIRRLSVFIFVVFMFAVHSPPPPSCSPLGC